jgi:pyruvate kinase
MSVARLNLTYGTRENHLELLNNLRQALSELNGLCAVLVSLAGANVRTGRANPNVNVSSGQCQ